MSISYINLEFLSPKTFILHKYDDASQKFKKQRWKANSIPIIPSILFHLHIYFDILFYPFFFVAGSIGKQSIFSKIYASHLIDVAYQIFLFHCKQNKKIVKKIRPFPWRFGRLLFLECIFLLFLMESDFGAPETSALLTKMKFCYFLSHQRMR